MLQQEGKTIDLRGSALILGSIAWLVGIFIDSFIALPSLILLPMAAITLILIVLLGHHQRTRLLTCVLLCLLLGAWRYSSASSTNDPLALSHAIGTNLTIRGEVSDEPKLSVHTRLLAITANAISQDRGITWQEAHGQLTIQLLGTEIDDPYGANYGSTVKISGKLQAPQPNSMPNILASMAFPRVQVTGNTGNPILAALYSWRITLRDIIAQSLPQPYAALMIGILLGLHTPALNLIAQDFNNTATTHLTVSSGFKVTLLAGLVASSTRWFYSPNEEQAKLLPAQKRGGWQRWLSTSLILASIAIYTILNGAGAAAIRAGMMGSLLVIAPRMGRIYNIYTALAFTAILISFGRPFVLWDVSFQLSFLGTLGIVLLTPFFQRLLHPIERIPITGHIISETLAVSLAAQIATLPIIMLDFHVFSGIGPVANALTVPFLGILLLLGVLICASGLLFLPLASLMGWIAFPLLWYIKNIITLCATPQWAHTPIDPQDSTMAWCYYAILALIIIVVISTQPSLVPSSTERPRHNSPTGISRRTWQLIQLGLALLIITTTAMVALGSQTNGKLTITFLNVTSQGQSQGEAILLRTPDGKTLLINGGLDASSLAQELDSRLPPWQRSLDAVLLTSPRQDHLTGLLDIVQRYTIGVVLDGGMLHPSTTYTRWRHTISERKLQYIAINQNTSTLTIGKFVSLQVLWPSHPLYKGSDEARANGLIVRIVTPGLSVLLLGASAQSNYALSGLLNTVDDASLQANVVQMVEDTTAPFPNELNAVMQKAHPTQLVMTPAAISKKQAKVSTTKHSTSLVDQEKWWQNIPTVRTAQKGTCELSSKDSIWSIDIV